MSVTDTSKLAQLLPVVISSGRPGLIQRSTTRLLPHLAQVTAEPVWVVREDEAAGYQSDGHELASYPRDWAEDWADSHWFGVEARPEGFTSAAPGREWACQLAQERGHWGVLMLDDNIRYLSLFRFYQDAVRVTERSGGLGLFADVLAAVVLSTNARFAGPQLTAVNPVQESGTFARAGFPYSLFVEVCDQDREPWLGPAEDDILHAFQYHGNEGSPWTAAVVVPLRYMKNHQVGGGFHEFYGPARSAGLQRMVPQGARLGVMGSFANGRGQARVFHRMTASSIRTPLGVHDRDLFGAARDLCSQLGDLVAAEARWDLKVRLAQRAARAGDG